MALQRTAPAGTERLYVDGDFFAASPDMCESYGKDTITGAPAEPAEYKAKNPAGKGIIKAAEFVPPHEVPSDDFPYQLTTGRTLYHFHTRTKTARAPQLNAAAPQVWIEMSAADATREGFTEGDLLRGRLPTVNHPGPAARQRNPRRRHLRSVPLRLLG